MIVPMKLTRLAKITSGFQKMSRQLSAYHSQLSQELARVHAEQAMLKKHAEEVNIEQQRTASLSRELDKFIPPAV